MAPLCKIVVLGSGGVGKSAITTQFVQNVFIEQYDPTIEDSYRKHHEVDGKPVVLEILDTAGTEQFTAMRDLYLKNGEGFMIVFSLVSAGSFLEIRDLREQIVRVKDSDNFPMLVLGNKCDLVNDREVSDGDIQRLCKTWKVPFLETSAKTRVNIEESFENITRQIFKYQNKNLDESVPEKTQKGCCVVL